jgi:hypothetical protein
VNGPNDPNDPNDQFVGTSRFNSSNQFCTKIMFVGVAPASRRASLNPHAENSRYSWAVLVLLLQLRLQ